MKKLKTYISISALYALPAVALGAGFDDKHELSKFALRVVIFINQTLVPFLFALALLLFIYGVYKYFIAGGGEEESRKEGRQVILWAIIAFVVIVSVWGIVNLISGGIGLADDSIKTDLIPKATVINS